MASESQGNPSFFTKVVDATLVILILVAVVLAYFLYQKMDGKAIPFWHSTETSNTNPQSSTGSPNNPVTPSHSPTPIISYLTADERAVLNPPKPGASEEEFRAHAMLVQRVAVETKTLTIGEECRMTPAILRAQQGKTLELRNNDSVVHTIVFDGALSFAVPANSAVPLPIDFGKGVGLYGYACDKTPSASGMILVTE